jgi:uncharacterized protein YukE
MVGTRRVSMYEHAMELARRMAEERDERYEQLKAAEHERDRLRRALRTIADRTYATQYDGSLPAVVRFANGLHATAREALERRDARNAA